MTINLHDTTDAAVWAAEFCKIFSSAPCRVPGGEVVIDGDDFEEIMRGWFASAIMAGVDSEARKAVDPATIRAEALREAAEISRNWNGFAVGAAYWPHHIANAILALIDREQDK